MKKILLILAIIAAMPMLAQQNLERSMVSVTGEGEVKVAPDQVLIKSRIEHEGASAAKVKRENDEVVAQVIKYLKSQNIDEKDINTEYVNLNKKYDYNDKTHSYVANQAISIKLRDLKDYERIMKGLLENGLNRIDEIQFMSSEIGKHKKEARKLAVLDAQNRARELAQPLGQNIGKAVSISEMNYRSVQPVYRMDAAVEMSSAKGSEQTIAPGQLEVKIEVNVGFELN